MTRPEFQKLAAVPAELEWFANIDNPRTRRAYQIDLQEFLDFVGIQTPTEMRVVTRAHVTIEPDARAKDNFRRIVAPGS